MPNTNFQTFHQMGHAINEVVRQATGRDAVQNIDMDHVTVAQNQYYEEGAVSGSVVSFTDKVGNTPLEKCVVQIEPVQDLHGYSKPWPSGGGKNILQLVDGTYILGGTGVTVSISNGIVTANGTATAGGGRIAKLSGDFTLKAGTYYAKSFGENMVLHINKSSDNSALNVREESFTIAEDTLVYAGINVAANVTYSNTKATPMLSEGSTAPTEWTPYSNICPISGWTGANIHVSPTTDAQDGQTYAITFPSEAGTVYGGTLTVNADGSGTLVVDRQILQMDSLNWLYESGSVGFVYNNTNIKHGTSGELISSIFVWSTESKANMPNNSIRINSATTGGLFVKSLNISSSSDFLTLVNGQTVVFPLENPVTYALTTEQIKTIQGINNIWADTGDIEVQYKVLKEMY